MTHARIRYLTSKRSVDERSRSRRVADRLFEGLPEVPTVGEAGAGIGATVPWLVERRVTAGSYRDIDLSSTVIDRAYFPEWDGEDWRLVERTPCEEFTLENGSESPDAGDERDRPAGGRRGVPPGRSGGAV